MQFVFLTGMSRSGTTLLSRCFNKFPSTKSFPQPLPLLYRAAKTAFFKGIGYPETIYVLNNYFDESRYSLGDFVKFLEKWELEPGLVRDLLAKMEGWSGQQTEMRLEKLVLPSKKIKLSDTVKELLMQMTDNSLKVLVTKEIHCEDFISYFLEYGWKVVLMVRNPLDVLTSIQYGRGACYVGKRRPTLFHIRNWRKSAQFAIYHQEKSNFQIIRYEDLIKDSTRELSRLAKFLCVNPAEIALETAFGIAGISWPENSSFPKEAEDTSFFLRSSIGRHEQILSPEIREFIFSLCWPEMKFFGYTDSPVPASYNPAKFIEPFNGMEPEFSSSYSSTDQTDKERIRLLAISRGSILAKQHERLFLNRKVFNALQIPSPYPFVK